MDSEVTYFYKLLFNHGLYNTCVLFCRSGTIPSRVLGLLLALHLGITSSGLLETNRIPEIEPGSVTYKLSIIYARQLL